MKKINMMLRKCKSLSRQLGRSSSYSSLRSKSSREEPTKSNLRKGEEDDGDRRVVLVGSTRKRCHVSFKYLSHPLVSSLIERCKKGDGEIERCKKGDGEEDMLVAKCEVVLFDHLLWMLENTDPNLCVDSMEELADLYVF